MRKRIARGADEPRAFADNALAVEFGVSPMTVRQAIQQLVSEGLLIRQRGKGTMVAPRPLRGSPQVMERLLEDWRLQGRDCRADILDRKLVAANLRVAAVLGVQPDEKVAFVRRLRLVDGEPIALDNRYLSADLCEHFSNRDLAEKSIFILLRDKLHLPVTQATFTIRAVTADEGQARLLQIKRGAPILDREIDITSADGRVLMTGNSLFHPDRFIFVTTTPLDEAASGEA